MRDERHGYSFNAYYFWFILRRRLESISNGSFNCMCGFMTNKTEYQRGVCWVGVDLADPDSSDYNTEALIENNPDRTINIVSLWHWNQTIEHEE